jgi:hypothetical protein
MLGCLAASVTRGGTLALDFRIQVVFENPEHYEYASDKRFPAELRSVVVAGGPVQGDPSNPVRNGILTIFSEFLTQHAPAYLPDGYTLTITFANINLSASGPSAEAGGFMWSGNPMFTFDWVITDRSGAVQRKGSERLAPFSLGIVELHNDAFKKDPYYYDKAVLDEWMRHNIRM